MKRPLIHTRGRHGPAANRFRSNSNTGRQLSLDDALREPPPSDIVAQAEAVVRTATAHLADDERLFAEFAREYLSEHGPTSEDELFMAFSLWRRGYITAVLEAGHAAGEYSFTRGRAGVRIWAVPR